MSESYGDEITDLNVPLVLAFTPTKYERVQADKVSEWETLMRENVGLDLPASQLRGNPSICFCPNADDCDQV